MEVTQYPNILHAHGGLEQQDLSAFTLKQLKLHGFECARNGRLHDSDVVHFRTPDGGSSKITFEMVSAGLHCSFKMSKQMLPWLLMFG